MTGWILLLALMAITGAALWRFGRIGAGGVELLGAALLLAAAGYAWQGRPGLEGQPTPPPVAQAMPDSDFARLRAMMFAKFTGDAQVLETADAFHRQGLEDYAVGILKSALVRRPRSADLWVGLGNALVGHADGLMTPAAELAFQRAQTLSPLHPGPPFFLGLAYAQTGQLDRARALWVTLLARTPVEAPWRADLIARIAAVDAVLR